MTPPIGKGLFSCPLKFPNSVRRQFSAPERIWICQLLVDLQFAKSKGEPRRLIGQKAVKVDGQIVSDVDFEFRGGVHRLVEAGKTRIAQAADGA